jgi:hypothetical protein
MGNSVVPPPTQSGPRTVLIPATQAIATAEKNRPRIPGRGTAAGINRYAQITERPRTDEPA